MDSPKPYAAAMFFVIFLILLSEFAQGANEEPDLSAASRPSPADFVAE